MQFLKPDYYTKYITILGFIAIIVQLIISKLTIYNNFLELFGFIIGALLLILGNINHFSYYNLIYQKAGNNISVKNLLFLFILLICTNAFISGFVAYIIDKNMIIQAIIDSFPWTVLHGSVSVIAMLLLYLLIIKLSNSAIKVRSIFKISLIAYLLAGIIFTPSGTIGYAIKNQIKDEILVILYKSFCHSISLAILTSFLVDLIIINIEKDNIRNKILNNLEYIIGFISFSIYLIFFITYIGDFSELNKRIPLILYAILFYCMYYCIFHIAFQFILLFRSNIGNKTLSNDELQQST